MKNIEKPLNITLTIYQETSKIPKTYVLFRNFYASPSRRRLGDENKQKYQGSTDSLICCAIQGSTNSLLFIVTSFNYLLIDFLPYFCDTQYAIHRDSIYWKMGTVLFWC